MYSLFFFLHEISQFSASSFAQVSSSRWDKNIKKGLLARIELVKLRSQYTVHMITTTPPEQDASETLLSFCSITIVLIHIFVYSDLTLQLLRLGHTAAVFSSPGCFGWCNNSSVMPFAVRVRVEEPVTLQTQPLDTCGALSVHSGKTTDGTGLFRVQKHEKKKQKRGIKLTKTHFSALVVSPWFISFIKQVINMFLITILTSNMAYSTLFGALYSVPLVIGSGGVAVEEVIACITERFIVTRRAKQRHSATT